MEYFSSIASLHEAYKSKKVEVSAFLKQCLKSIRDDEHNAWISVITDKQLFAYLENLSKKDKSLPLWGVPFAVKDNIDLFGLDTTAACKEYAYTPSENAYAVELLIKAGAIPLGKTNLDQFATGLVGVRSPYGACKNSIKPEYVSGGSSSGSAVSVAVGQVMFSLGTDTAGSGRVPAAFNNILGLKGTCGRVSTTGVVPACKSLDCLTVFANNTDDLSKVFSVISNFDKTDCYARQSPATPYGFKENFVFGVPKDTELEFFHDDEAKQLFYKAVNNLIEIGGKAKQISLKPFLDAAKLLYEGSFVAERLSGNKDFFDTQIDDCLPVIKTIIGNSAKFSAADAYSNNYKLMELKRIAYQELEGTDFVITPTTGTIYKIKDVEHNPIELNSNLGYYTNFMNLLDFCAIALPAGFRKIGDKKGLPFGVTLFSKAFNDEALLALAARYTNYCKYPVGANKLEYTEQQVNTLTDSQMQIVVCGAHLEGLPLNYQLTQLGAMLYKKTRTSAHYKMYKLEGEVVKPGLVRSENSGFDFEVEVYKIPKERVGDFLSLIPYPLGLGKVELSDGSFQTGFVCEGEAIKNAEDISSFGSFKSYLKSL